MLIPTGTQGSQLHTSLELQCSQATYSGQSLVTDGTNTSWTQVGTVYSVGMTVPAFLSITGTPVTGTGTLAIGLSGTPLPIANGGTASSSAPTQGGVAYGTGTAIAYTSAGTAGQALISNGTSTPSWGTVLTSTNATLTGTTALRGSYGGGAITSNFAAGDGALVSNTTGSYNTASGYQALEYNTTGLSNTASGAYALYSNTTGAQNTASGAFALYSNTTGSGNTASGYQSLEYNTTGAQNTASGAYALYSNTTGLNNTASGTSALSGNNTGNYNTASGAFALSINTTGSQNTASGYQALYSNTTGSYNTASGTSALYNNTTGSGNTAFSPFNSAGSYAPVFDPSTQNNRFCMGSTGVTNAYIQVAWTVVSDARDKTNFAPVPHGLDFVNQLQPTAYQFKEDRETDVATGIVRYGFKAQDILALEGDTPVIIDIEDLDKLKFNSDSLIPVLVNAIKELNAKVTALETQLAGAK